MLTDSPTSPADIKYFYVKSFKWNVPMGVEMFDGNPKKGKVYRGWQNANTEGYRLIFKTLNAIVLEQLYSDGSSLSYTSDIAEITMKNVLDLPLTEKDLDLLNMWMDSGNTDLMPAEPPVLDISNMISKALDKKSELEILLDTLHNDIEELADMDTLMLYQVSKIVSYALSEIHALRVGPFDYDWLNMDKQHGMGANVSSALKSLYSYMGSKENEETIMSSIHDLLVEMKRREHNNLQ